MLNESFQTTFVERLKSNYLGRFSDLLPSALPTAFVLRTPCTSQLDTYYACIGNRPVFNECFEISWRGLSETANRVSFAIAGLTFDVPKKFSLAFQMAKRGNVVR
jgi:hypothetical protein